MKQLKNIEDSKVVICGAARDVEKTILRFVSDMQLAFSNFREVHFVFCESFSKDETRITIQELTNFNSTIHMVDDFEVNKNENRRTVRIASARNAIKNYVTKNFSEFDYVVMADLDGVNRNITRKAVESCWTIGYWDMVSASQTYKYYDVWALRAREWCENDCWEEYERLKLQYTEKIALRLAITSKMRSIPRASDPIPVMSAFGGFSIYRLEAFKHGNYVGVLDDGKEVCEHVPFNLQLSSLGFELFIAPKLVNLNSSTQRLTRMLEVFK